MIKEDFFIPINDAIERFHEHLREHSRTILSAFSYPGCYIAYIKRKVFYAQVHYCNPRYTYPSKFAVRSIDDNGRADCEFYRFEEGEKKYDAEMSEILDKLLRMVAT